MYLSPEETAGLFVSFHPRFICLFGLMYYRTTAVLLKRPQESDGMLKYAQQVILLTFLSF
ncbi:hypothetical protein Cst_c06050 [Thermoclostridium stercorarium subsp. stercorarium DSM 8532]|uniref:Uncharacterized protein n=1 Tax=Thermoclostridium stercorarium (strain ATCC 35414 / DSM 8532 / NCIMB 11754) TaxID=1121335 RepID=L7VLQ9_THES1|nr:hypothetical protein Cst_c06050 [Thermoclostridium stercorarium subsp. stercorarium DSM 8532]